MAIADFFKGALSEVKGLFGEVGDGRENREEDVKQIKRGLGTLGYWQEPKHGVTGFIDRELDEGIKDFQADHGLRVDGWMRPRGETESALHTRKPEDRPARDHAPGARRREAARQFAPADRRRSYSFF